MKPKLKSAPLLLILCLLLFVDGAAAQSPTAVLSVGSGSGYPGDSGIIVSVDLDPQSAEVNILNFDLHFDPTALSVGNVEKGSAAVTALKTMTSHVYSDYIRVAIYDENTVQVTIGQGELVNVTFNVLPSASPGITDLYLTNVTVGDLDVNPVDHTEVPGTFTVLGPTPTNTPTSTSTGTPTNTPTVTQTSTVTRTPTITQTPTITRTPTITKTPGPTATSTKTYTPGPSPTITRTPTSSLTPTLDLTSSPTVTASPTPTFDPKGGALSQIELAVAATGTALAEFEAAVAGTATALAPPGSETGASVETPSGSSSWLSQWWDILLLGALVLGLILLVIGWRILVLRRRKASEAEEPEPDLIDRRLG
jgi:hypothetical protein